MPAHGDDEIHRLGRAGPVGQRLVEEIQVRRGEGPDEGERPVLDRDADAAASASAPDRQRRSGRSRTRGGSRRASVSLRTPNPSMNGSGEAYPQLEQRPDERHTEEDLGRKAARRAHTGIGLRDHVLEGCSSAGSEPPFRSFISGLRGKSRAASGRPRGTSRRPTRLHQASFLVVLRRASWRGAERPSLPSGPSEVPEGRMELAEVVEVLEHGLDDLVHDIGGRRRRRHEGRADTEGLDVAIGAAIHPSGDVAVR